MRGCPFVLIKDVCENSLLYLKRESVGWNVVLLARVGEDGMVQI